MCKIVKLVGPVFDESYILPMEDLITSIGFHYQLECSLQTSKSSYLTWKRTTRFVNAIYVTGLSW